MSGVTVVVQETADESIAQKVIETSRQLYAKKVEIEEKQPDEPKQKDTAKIPQKSTKPKKKRARKKSDDELSTMKSVT